MGISRRQRCPAASAPVPSHGRSRWFEPSISGCRKPGGKTVPARVCPWRVERSRRRGGDAAREGRRRGKADRLPQRPRRQRHRAPSVSLVARESGPSFAYKSRQLALRPLQKARAHHPVRGQLASVPVMPHQVYAIGDVAPLAPQAYPDPGRRRRRIASCARHRRLGHYLSETSTVLVVWSPNSILSR
jgi:hypothetical protein